MLTEVRTVAVLRVVVLTRGRGRRKRGGVERRKS